MKIKYLALSAFALLTLLVPSVSRADITTGLLGYWNFDAGSGSTATDSSGNGNNGTLTGGPVWNTGKISGGLSFAGSNDLVNVGRLSTSEGQNQMSWSFWVNDTFTGNNGCFICKSDSIYQSKMSWSIRNTPTGFIGTTNDVLFFAATNLTDHDQNDGACTSRGNALVNGQWNHVVVVYDGTQTGNAAKIKFYINNSIASFTNGDCSGTIAPQTLASMANVTIGAEEAGSTRQFGGSMDDVRIYNRALSASDVSELFSYTGGVVTPPPADTTAPVISSVTSSSITTTGANITWNTDESSDTQVEYGLTTSYGSQTSLNSTLSTSHSASLSSLTANTLYHYRVKSRDAASNLATGSDNTFTTSAVAVSDTTAPSVPTSLTATAVSSSVINLAWTASSDAVGVTGYRIYRNSSLIATTPSTSYTDSSLSASTQYTYTLSAIDAALNASAQTGGVSATTQAAVVSQSGTTITATTCSQSDVQTAITQAQAGYTVQIPAGTCTWSSIISFSKAIKLQGAGAGRVVARSATNNTVGLGTKTFTLTTENVASIAALRSAITNGTTLKIWRTGGEISNGEPTGAIPWMRGTVTSISGNTLTMNITSVGGSGTHPVWIIATEANTTILNNVSNNSLIKITEDTSSNIEISGIRFEHAPGLSTNVDTSANFIELNNTSGGQPILVHDNFFLNYTYGNQILAHTNKGVIWNSSFVSLPVARGPLAIHTQAQAISNSWTTASTMGTNDTTGKSNLYTEDSDFHAWQNATDYDDNARATMRYNLFDNAGFGTHGADSSSFGQRHFEVYNSEFFRNDFSNGQTINNTQWFLIRGGTGVIADNIIPAFTGSDYGGAPGIKLALWNLQCNCGPNPLWGSGITGIQYPLPRQIGRGYVNGSSVDGKGRSTDVMTFVGDLEPLYIWGNTGGYNVILSEYTTPSAGQDLIADYIVAGRDYFNNGTPKPGYTKFQYPHPLRTGSSVSAPSPVNGVCSSTVSQCSAGSLSEVTDSSTQYLWNCVGSNGGNTASCSATIPVVVVTDTTLPTVSMSSPNNGATVSGASVSIAATASDNIGVIGVQFKLDGNNLGSELTTSPYSGAWDTTGVSNGSHTLTATARDAAGNIKVSSTVTITVSNTAVTTPTTPTTPSGGGSSGGSSGGGSSSSGGGSSSGSVTTTVTTPVTGTLTPTVTQKPITVTVVTPAGYTNSSSISLTKSLLYGMTDPEVKTLQTILISKGLLTGVATGYFGSLTQAAVIKFQSSLGIPTTGTVGPLTRLALGSTGTTQTTQTTVTTPATTLSVGSLSRSLYKGIVGTDVTVLQKILQSKGYLSKTVTPTTLFGPATENAVKAFQCAKMSICSGSVTTNGYGFAGAKTRVELLK